NVTSGHGVLNPTDHAGLRCAAVFRSTADTRSWPGRSTISVRPGTSAMRSPRSAVATRRCSTDEGHGPDVDGDEPRQVHRMPHLLDRKSTRLNSSHVKN